MKVYVVAFGLLLAAPAFAQTSGTARSNGEGASSPGQVSESANGSGDRARPEQRQICRRIESDVSRRIGSRLVCHTAQEWREIQRDS